MHSLQREGTAWQLSMGKLHAAVHPVEGCHVVQQQEAQAAMLLQL